MKLLLVGLLALAPLMAQDKNTAKPEGRNVTAADNHSKEIKTSPLRMGDSSAAARREDIKEAQKSLNDKGFDCGPADGVLGARTRAGIRQYQESENLPVTGRLDAQTTGKLGAGPKSIAGNSKGARHDVAENMHRATQKMGDIKEAQKSLNNKGFDCGPADGVLGARTRAGIRQYQESENLPVTGRLDVETAGKLGVGPESIAGNFEGAGHDVAEGSRELGHEVKQGKPVAAGKEFGKGIGRAAQKIGAGVVDAVTPDSDRGDREAKRQESR